MDHQAQLLINAVAVSLEFCMPTEPASAKLHGIQTVP